MANRDKDNYKFITDTDWKLIEELNLGDNILHAYEEIIKKEFFVDKEKRKINDLKEFIVDSLNKRSELYYKYGI